MVSIDELLDLNDPDADVFLSGIRGNILKPHARAHAARLLVRFRAGRSTNRKWIAEFASPI